MEYWQTRVDQHASLNGEIPGGLDNSMTAVADEVVWREGVQDVTEWKHCHHSMLVTTPSHGSVLDAVFTSMINHSQMLHRIGCTCRDSLMKMS